MVICTDIVYFVDLQSSPVALKARLIQSHLAKQYSSYNLGERRKDQWFLNDKFVSGFGLDDFIYIYIHIHMFIFI